MKELKLRFNNSNQYEERTAVSEGASARAYETSFQEDHLPYQTPRMHHSPAEVAKNEELLSLLIGEREETKAQKRERQKRYREALEQQKKINDFYIKNLNPE